MGVLYGTASVKWIRRKEPKMVGYEPSYPWLWETIEEHASIKISLYEHSGREITKFSSDGPYTVIFTYIKPDGSEGTITMANAVPGDELTKQFMAGAINTYDLEFRGVGGTPLISFDGSGSPASSLDTCILGGVTLDLEPIPPYFEVPKPRGPVEVMLDGTYEIQDMGADIVWPCTLVYVLDATLVSLAALAAACDPVTYTVNGVSQGTFYIESFGPPNREVGKGHWTLSMSLLKVA